MNKDEIMKICNKDEDRFLVAKLLDKIQFASQKNQIQVTGFLDGYQQKLALKVLQQTKYKNYNFFGGFQDAERRMLFFFPDKLFDLIQEPLQNNKIIQEEMEIISINLPNDLKGKYHHRDYLSGIMKLGIKREKVGDILVRDDGADILVKKDISNYLLNNLKELTRFKKSELYIKSIDELDVVLTKMEIFTIVVTQLRLDTVISEVLHISRTKTNEIISQERVFVNYEVKTKNSFVLQEGDLLTVRGKGKFKIGNIISQTVKGKLRVEVYKYTS